MKKTLKARHAGFLALAIACCGSLVTASVAQAQYPERSRRDTQWRSSYERMRQWAHELDQVARHASEQAQAQQGGYRGFRRDTNFLRSIDHFADQAQAFHERMDNYVTRPWNVDDEIATLLRDARDVQYRIRRARFVDRRTARDWDHVVQLLNQMTSEYRTYAWNREGRFGRDRRDNPNAPGNTYPDTRGNEGYAQPNDSSTYSTDLQSLAQELDERAARIVQMSDRSGSRYGNSSDFRRFSDEARDFRTAVEGRQLSQPELRSRVNRLLQDAQTAHEEISRSRIGSDVAAEWDGIVQVLNRMRDLMA